MSEAGATGRRVFWNHIKRLWRIQNSGGLWLERIPQSLGLDWRRSSEDYSNRRHHAACEAQDPARSLSNFSRASGGELCMFSFRLLITEHRGDGQGEARPEPLGISEMCHKEVSMWEVLKIFIK